MSNKKTIVNSWNEWDPLKHVILGRADNCCIPAPEPAVDVKIPADSDMKGTHGRRTQDTIWVHRCQDQHRVSSAVLGSLDLLKEHVLLHRFLYRIALVDSLRTHEHRTV